MRFNQTDMLYKENGKKNTYKCLIKILNINTDSPTRFNSIM